MIAGGEELPDIISVTSMNSAQVREYGRGGYGPRRANKVQFGVQITEDCDNPRLAFRFLDFMSSDECYYWQFALDLNDGSWTSTQYLKAQQQMANYDAAGLPEQVFYTMMRTDEEEAIFNDYNADLVDFVKKSRAEFCNGLMDPADDAQWQKYLDSLYGLHYQEAWFDLAQASWDRQQAYANGN